MNKASTSYASAVADAITQRWGEYRDILMRGDPQALASMFTENAVLLEPGMEEFRGREAIERFATGMFDEFMLTAITGEITELTVHGDSVYEWGTYVEQGGRPGEPITSYPGRYMAFWQRAADGKWRIHRMMVHRLY